MTTPVHIGSTKHLFLDDHVVVSLDNVVRQIHRHEFAEYRTELVISRGGVT